MPPPAEPVRVCLEVGARRTFASALDWPGWSRSGRGEDAALDALRAYLARYAPVCRAAGLAPPDPACIEVSDRVAGNATTDFGAPGAIAGSERAALEAAQAERLARLLQACWAAFDRIAAAAPPRLRRGPRGGGRDRDAVVEHVLGAEAQAYAPKLGLRLPLPGRGDSAAVTAARAALLEVLRASVDDPERADPPRGWPVRYAVRRIAWHVTDHAWEIEDRIVPAG
jgi:hypothetical protein